MTKHSFLVLGGPLDTGSFPSDWYWFSPKSSELLQFLLNLLWVLMTIDYKMYYLMEAWQPFCHYLKVVWKLISMLGREHGFIINHLLNIRHDIINILRCRQLAFLSPKKWKLKNCFLLSWLFPPFSNGAYVCYVCMYWQIGIHKPFIVS